MVLCVVLGAGLLGGAATGSWLSGGGHRPAADQAYDDLRALWRELPVDDLFPSEFTAEGAGPGGADRRWIRVAVAPDQDDCAPGFDPALLRELASAGCHRLLRASYADETESSVTTVGILFTEADAATMRALRDRFAAEGLARQRDLLPRAYAAPGTAAADFADEQRATWSVRVLTDLPVVVSTVTGFADGRSVTAPEPATEATRDGADSAVALAGLGHEAKALADRVERRLRRAAAQEEDG